MTRILVVKDERSVRRAFWASLEEGGCDVAIAAGFLEAEPFLTERSCDVVVADMALPGVDGLDLLQQVRRIDADIPVIVIAEEPDVSTVAEALRHSAGDCVARSVAPEMLNHIVERALERRRLLDDKRRLEAENCAYQVELERLAAGRTAELEQRRRELTTLIEIYRDVSATLDLTAVLRRVALHTAQACAAHRCTIFLLSEDGETLIPVMSQFSDDHVNREMWRLFQDGGCPVLVSQVSEIQQIVHQRRPVFIPDAPASSIPMCWIEPFGIKSLLGVPMVTNERVVGVMWLDHVENGREFAADQVDLAVAIGMQAAVAVENAQLHAELKRRLKEMVALHETALDVTAQLDMPYLLDAIIARASELLGATGGVVRLYDPASDRLVAVASHNLAEDLSGRTFKVGEGLSGKVFQTGDSLIVDDYCAWSGRSPQISDTDVRSVVGVPLVWRERVIGVLDVIDSVRVGAFDEQDLRLLVPFADQAAIAIENARLFAETSRRLAETRLLQEVALAVSSTLDFDEVLARTIETLHRILGFSHLAFVVPDEQGDGLLLHPSRIGYPSGARLPLDGSVSGRVYQSGEPQVMPDVQEVPYYFEGVPGIHSALAVPVKVSGRVVAVLNAESTQIGAFDEDDLRLFSSIAAQLGAALESTSLYEETNRRLTEARLIQEVMLAAASTLDFDLVLERTVKALHRALEIDRLGFLLPDKRGDALVLHPSLVGFTGGVLRIPIEGTLVGRAYRIGQSVLMRDAVQRPAYADQAPDVRSALAVPVRVGGHVVAVLHAESPRENAFDADELRLFTTFAGQLGVALENARLYQRLEAQAAELSQAYEELREINRLRTELVQNVGHELRTPLGLVKGYVELLLGGELGNLGDSQRNALQVVRARTATLERLIHNLTVLQAVPREALTLAPMSIGETVKRALMEFRVSAEKVGVVFRDELPAGLPPVLGDQDRLQLVFSHLVDNGIKFSPNGGTITIRAWADQDMVHVSIADEGVGIPFEHRGRIFERFYQVDGSASRRFGGMGVGLALVWEIVEAHYGTVVVDSEPGEGSMFTVALRQVDRTD
jgi:GAF domain-containing protein/CheY-like chemotaxis protein/anti-sigma regulatory factor (Ser/Thr protein kinase)